MRRDQSCLLPQISFKKYWYKFGIIVILSSLVHYFLHLCKKTLNNKLINVIISKNFKEKRVPKSSQANTKDDSVDNEVFQQASSTSEILVSLRKLEAKMVEIYNICTNLCKLKKTNN